MRFALPVLLACAACSEPDQLARGLDDLRTLAGRAREAGAYRCAPEELALAEAHLEFARHELDQGDAARAREHLVLARVNASAALRLSDRACAEPRDTAGADAPDAAGADAPDAAGTNERPIRRAPSTRSTGRASSTRDATTIKEDHASI